MKFYRIWIVYLFTVLSIILYEKKGMECMAVIELTSENFEQEVLKSEIPVLVDFWAPWCGPCKMMSPVVDEVAEEVTAVKVCKLNTDEAEEIAFRYRVMSIPTLMLFHKGERVKSSVGVISKSELLSFIQI